MKLLAALALAIALLPSTASAPTVTGHRALHPAVQDTRRTAAPDGIEALQARLTAAYAQVELPFDPDNNAPVAKVLAEARARWGERLRTCTNDGCRRAILSDQLARIDYAFGRNARPFPAIHWDTGDLEISAPTYPFGTVEGMVNIFPVIDDQLLIWVSSIASPTGQWMCEMAALGRIQSGAVVEMRSLDEAGARFRMRPRHGRLQIDRIDGSPPDHCGGFGSIADDYRVHAIHQPDDPGSGRAAQVMERLATEQLPRERDEALRRLRQETGQ